MCLIICLLSDVFYWPKSSIATSELSLCRNMLFVMPDQAFSSRDNRSDRIQSLVYVCILFVHLLHESYSIPDVKTHWAR
jgi:hypothetical protein